MLGISSRPEPKSDHSFGSGTRWDGTYWVDKAEPEWITGSGLEASWVITLNVRSKEKRVADGLSQPFTYRSPTVEDMFGQRAYFVGSTIVLSFGSRCSCTRQKTAVLFQGWYCSGDEAILSHANSRSAWSSGHGDQQQPCFGRPGVLASVVSRTSRGDSFRPALIRL